MTLSDLVVKRIIIFLSLAPAALLAQTAQYVGSAACKSCHSAIYNRWSKTRMANVVRDPKTHPEAIIPDLASPIRWLTSPKTTLLSFTGVNGNSATSRKRATTIILWGRNGT